MTEDIELKQRIGRRLKDLRKIRGSTLESLAERTGFTKGYLSKIENAKKVPPIETLSRLSTALNADISYFLQTQEMGAEADERISVVRAHERKPTVEGGSTFSYNYETIAHNKRNKAMEPFIFTFPTEFADGPHFSHEGEEMVFVLSGTVDFEVEGKSLVLSPGDCVYVDASIEHRGRAVGGEAKALVVIYQPGSRDETAI
jgi:transcriptional regulator with XRE-family HTH domain